MFAYIHHGGTTEKGNCSYLLPRVAAAGSNGTNKGQIHKVPVDEIAWFLVYCMGVTRSQMTANTGIPVCLDREIWQFKVFAGKEVTPLHEEGNSLQFRAGKKATHFHYKWFIIYFLNIYSKNRVKDCILAYFEQSFWDSQYHLACCKCVQSWYMSLNYVCLMVYQCSNVCMRLRTVRFLF